MQKMRNDLLSKAATLATAATFFLALALCSGQLSASAGPEPPSYYSRLSTNGERPVGQPPAYSSKQQGSGDTSASEGRSTVRPEKAVEITRSERRRSSASLSRSRAGLLGRTSGAASKVLAASVSVVAVIFLLWRLGSVVWKCLTQTGTPRAGASPRSLSASEGEGRKDVCVDLELAASADSGAEGRRGVHLEPLLVTVVAVGIVLAGFAFFIYSAVTSWTPTSTTEPESGPGRYGTQVLTGALLLALGGFTFYMYLTVQRQTEGPRLPGSLDHYVGFFSYWGMIFIFSAICSFLSGGGPEAYLLPPVAALLVFLFLHTYWTNLRRLPRTPPREDDDKNEDSDKGAANPVFTIDGILV